MLLEASEQRQSGLILRISKTAYSAEIAILECAGQQSMLEHIASVLVVQHHLGACFLFHRDYLKTV
jgi:hypothetical protein